ncbi:MAG: cell division FtsA domain-containing protein [Halanaerobiaceae bacterium]
MDSQGDLIFALDIGTRTIIGLVLKYEEPEYEIIASRVIEHKTRAMLDGQIHNVREVARQVKKVKESLEDDLGLELKRAAIAAAGRALETVDIEYSLDFETGKRITEEDVQSLELGAIQESKKDLDHREDFNYHFVDYSVKEYYLDDIFLTDLVGQRGKEIRVRLVATFLPVIVIDSLLSVINEVDLRVDHLTLEPIAASRIVIPEEMYNFNLALLDIGAGTSDIALTEKGSMLGYGMVPVAGDEITEALTEHFLLDYNSGERVKRSLTEKKSIKVQNALGQEVKITREEALEVIKPEVEKLAQMVKDKIVNLNGSAPRAVICIGGGSLTPLFVSELALKLDLPKNRVGIRDRESLDQIKGAINGVSSTQSITPLGIGVTAHRTSRKNVFINVEVNGNPIQLYTLKRPRVTDALMAADIDIKDLRGRPGSGLTCTVNGKLKTIKGGQGQPGYVLINEKQAELETRISNGDRIHFEKGKKGTAARGKIADVLPEEAGHIYNLTVNGTSVELGTKILQNGEPVNRDTEIKDGAEIEFEKLETVGQAAARIMEVPVELIARNVIRFTLDGEQRVIPRGQYVLKKEERIIDPESQLEDGLEFNFVEVDFDPEQEVTIGDIFEQGEEYIDITFNNSPLEVPGQNINFYCQGQEITRDYVIKDGDQITYEREYPRIKDILDYINYDISEVTKSKITLKLNGEKVDFKKRVSGGDKLELGFNL